MQMFSRYDYIALPGLRDKASIAKFGQSMYSLMFHVKHPFFFSAKTQSGATRWPWAPKLSQILTALSPFYRR